MTEGDPEARPATIGLADPGDAPDHSPHAYLYVPDLSQPTGWATHAVPDREPDVRPARAVGFRRESSGP